MRLTSNTIVKAILLGMTVCTLYCQKASFPCGEGEIILSIEGDDGFDVETKATPVTTIPSTLYWGATTGSSTESAKWSTASASTSSSKIYTGKYQTASPTAYNYYLASQSFTVGGDMTVANNGTDIVAGRLAQSALNRTGTRYGDPVVLLYCDEAGVLYDDLVVFVGQRKKTLQLGTYRYKSLGGLWKTVPIVMVVDRG